MAATPARIAIPVTDQTWLEMDRPNNLMYIQSLQWHRTTPDWAEVCDLLQERVVDRHPVFSRRPVFEGNRWYWVDDEDFDLGRHMRVTRLPRGSTMDDLRRHISPQLSRPLLWDRPLWEIECIEGIRGIEGSTGAQGSAIYWRFHHAIGDGIRLTQMTLSLHDHEPGVGGHPRVGDRHGPGGPLDMVEQIVVSEAKGAIDLVGGVARRASHPARAVHRIATGIRRGRRDPWRMPAKLVEAVAELASEDNSAVNTARGLGRLLLEPSSPTLDWKGRPGVDKHVGWVESIDLTLVKDVARRAGGTVNDVMLTAVSLGITAYLREEGEENFPAAVNWLVPVSLQAFDEALPADLGNHFTLIMVKMPVGIDDPLDALAAMRTSMNRAKHSAEAQLMYAAQLGVTQLPQPVPQLVTNFIANKAVGQLTNVPGPTGPVTLAGVEVAGFLGWVPTSGNQSIGVCIFSYNGTVSIGINSDKVLVPNPQRVADLIAAAFEELATSV